jgi:hypothetical protein
MCYLSRNYLKLSYLSRETTALLVNTSTPGIRRIRIALRAIHIPQKSPLHHHRPITRFRRRAASATRSNRAPPSLHGTESEYDVSPQSERDNVDCIRPGGEGDVDEILISAQSSACEGIRGSSIAMDGRSRPCRAWSGADGIALLVRGGRCGQTAGTRAEGTQS